VGPGESKTIAYQYYTPGVLSFSARGAEYSLFIQKQPGAAGARTVLAIDPPPGYAVKSINVNGRTQPAGEIAVTLDEDVLITAALERS
jgi:hypothetical protein